MTALAKTNRPAISTKRSEALWKEACNYSPLGAQGEGKHYGPYPHFIDRAKGAYMWDADGNEYVDYWNGAGPSILGHSHPDVNQAVKDALDNHGITYCAPHQWELELAKKISQCVKGAEMSAFGAGGSDALCYAVRAARSKTGRLKIVKFEGAYHGWYDGLLFNVKPNLDKAGPDDAPISVAESSGLPPEATQYMTVLPFNDEAAVEKLFKAHGQEYACLLVEPVMHGTATGLVKPKPGFLKFLRDICTRHGVVLVFDEILTGFRHDIGGVQTLEGVVPDLTAFGKALSNGFPICSLSGKREFVNELMPAGKATFSGTFNGSIVCVAAALKTLEILSDPAIYKRMWALGERFSTGVNDSIKKLKIKAQAVSYGAMGAVFFTDRPIHNVRDILRHHDEKLNRAFVEYLWDHGVFLKPRRTARFALSAAHTEADIDRTIEQVEGFLTLHRAQLS